jgi:hypothetical protein
MFSKLAKLLVPLYDKLSELKPWDIELGYRMQLASLATSILPLFLNLKHHTLV